MNRGTLRPTAAPPPMGSWLVSGAALTTDRLTLLGYPGGSELPSDGHTVETHPARWRRERPGDPRRPSSELAFRQVATPNDRPLLVQLVNGGKIVGDESTMRERHLRARAELPLEALKMFRGEPVIETVFPGTGGRR